MKKMSLANIEGKLSRAEMRSIMAGSGTCNTSTCYVSNRLGSCQVNNNGKCRCFIDGAMTYYPC